MIVHLPIPSDEATLQAVWPHIAAFLPAIANRAEVAVELLADRIYSGEVQAHFAWDSDAKRALALLGTRIALEPEHKVVELIWLTGKGRDQFKPLLPSVEAWAKAEPRRCTAAEAICRKGWRETLETYGYRLQREEAGHLIMRKDL